MAERFKYCPNCAYRMRPELAERITPAPEPPPGSQRLLALGGYLAFASLLLLVVLAGIRIFTDAEVNLGKAEQTGVTRDRNPVPLDRHRSFRAFASGGAIWGLYHEGRERLVGTGPEESLVDDAFQLGIYEVTNDQYYLFLRARAPASRRPIPSVLYPTYWTRRTGDARVALIYDRDHGNEPVTSVAYPAALEFCAWLWQERFGADPDVVVDLPVADEFILAGRGDDVTYNFPWGPDLEQGDPDLEPGVMNLSGTVEPVDSPEVGEYRGLFGLIGNAAEWVHGYDAGRTPTAAGWSFESTGVPAIWQDRKTTPFGAEGFELWTNGPPLQHVGFRVLVRRAPALPEFVRVEAGSVRRGGVAAAALRPPLLLPNPEVMLDPEEDVYRESPVTFATPIDAVDRPFEIARAEISNRQFLTFLVDVATDRTPAEMEDLLPRSFRRPHPLREWGPADAPAQPVFRGPFGDPLKIPLIYEAGRENHPVAGITVEQARAYAAWLTPRCRLPTVAEFLRAARGDGDAPYPWGADPLAPGLICEGRRDDENRAVSLLGRLAPNAPKIVGLAGNLSEFVTDGNRVLLAGGFFALPAEGCTLDTFLDAGWDYVEWEDGGEVTGTFQLAHYAGFRVVCGVDLR